MSAKPLQPAQIISLPLQSSEIILALPQNAQSVDASIRQGEVLADVDPPAGKKQRTAETSFEHYGTPPSFEELSSCSELSLVSDSLLFQ